MNEILENYELLKQKIDSEHARIFFDMLDSKYPAFKSRAINELKKLKIETLVIKEYIDDPSPDVRLAAMKYLISFNKIEPDDIQKLLNDISHKIRKEAILYSLCHETEGFDIVHYCKDSNPDIRLSILKYLIENSKHEDKFIILGYFSDDPYEKIQNLLRSLDNFSKVMVNNNIGRDIKKAAMISYYIRHDSMTFYNSIKEIYNDCNDETKILIIRFMSGLPGDIIRTFIDKNIDDEKNLELLRELIKTCMKVLGKDSVPSKCINDFLRSENSKNIKFGLELAASKDDMSFVDKARNLMNERGIIDDEVYSGAVNYLSYFLDYTLTDFIPNMLESKSSKRMTLGIKVIRRLKLDKYLPELDDIAKSKLYPVKIRKDAMLSIKYFKGKDYWETCYNILKDEEENKEIKQAALNTLLRLNPEKIEEL